MFSISFGSAEVTVDFVAKLVEWLPLLAPFL